LDKVLETDLIIEANDIIMALSQTIQQKLMQKLSPQQIQLMKLLQIPTANLEERIKEELEENPALEESNEEDVQDDLEMPADDYETQEEDDFEPDGSEQEYELPQAQQAGVLHQLAPGDGRPPDEEHRGQRHQPEPEAAQQHGRNLVQPDLDHHEVHTPGSHHHQSGQPIEERHAADSPVGKCHEPRGHEPRATGYGLRATGGKL